MLLVTKIGLKNKKKKIKKSVDKWISVCYNTKAVARDGIIMEA